MDETDKLRLRRAVVLALQDRVGVKAAITGLNLTHNIIPAFRSTSRKELQREIRRQIGHLREDDGVLICAKSGVGYYMAADLREYREFALNELEMRIARLSRVKSRMDQAAVHKFGRQESLL